MSSPNLSTRMETDSLRERAVPADSLFGISSLRGNESFSISGQTVGRHSAFVAALGGQLEINHFEPIMASRLFESLELLDMGARLFADKCIAGIEANREASLERLLKSSALATVFVPKLGYTKVSEMVKKGIREDRPFLDMVIEEGLLSQDDVMNALIESTRYKPTPEYTSP